MYSVPTGIDVQHKADVCQNTTFSGGWSCSSFIGFPPKPQHSKQSADAGRCKAETHGIRLGSLLCLGTTRKVITENHPKHWTGIKHWVIQDSQGCQGWLMKTWRNNDNTNEIWENPTEKEFCLHFKRHSFRPNAYWLAQLECLKIMPLSCRNGWRNTIASKLAKFWGITKRLCTPSVTIESRKQWKLGRSRQKGLCWLSQFGRPDHKQSPQLVLFWCLRTRRFVTKVRHSLSGALTRWYY